MAIKRTTKIDASISMSSMTDIVFLLLIFFLITSTVTVVEKINELNLDLPKSSVNEPEMERAIANVSIQDNNGQYTYYIGETQVEAENLEDGIISFFDEFDARVQEEGKDASADRTISICSDATVPVSEIVTVMSLAKNNHWKMLLATKNVQPAE